MEHDLNLLKAFVRARVCGLQDANGKHVHRFGAKFVEQLQAAISPIIDLVPMRANALNDVWKKLVRDEVQLLNLRYDERRTHAQIDHETPLGTAPSLRISTALHLDLWQRLQAVLPDEPLSTPTHHYEIARLVLQMNDEPDTTDHALVLESLLLGDPVAQGFYIRFMALVVALEGKFHDMPMPEEIPLPPTAIRITRWERWITRAFVAVFLGVLAYVLWLLFAIMNGD